MPTWINLDYNATTPVAPEVMESMLPYFSELSLNPSSQGRLARQINSDIEEARTALAQLIGVPTDTLTFTSGATEANLTAILSHAHFFPPSDVMQGKPILVSPIEHSSVINNLVLHDQAFEYLKMDNQGVIDLANLEQKLSTGNYAYLNLMLANNETGVIQPVQEINQMLNEYQLGWHCDISQAVGKLSLNLSSFSSIISASISAHKFHGPKGIGVLYIKQGCEFKALIHGGGQESNRRSGTQNVPAIIGMGAAVQLAQDYLQTEDNCVEKLRDQFEQALLDQIPDCHVVSQQAPRLPNTSYLIFDNCEGEGLKILLDHYQVNCAIGSACLTGKQKASHVPLALGFSETQAKSALRFSLSRYTKQEEIDQAIPLIVKAVEKFRSVQAQTHSVGPVTVYKPGL